MPVLAILGSRFMVVACIFAHRMAVVSYLVVFLIVSIIGLCLKQRHKEQPRQ